MQTVAPPPCVVTFGQPTYPHQRRPADVLRVSDRLRKPNQTLPPGGQGGGAHEGITNKHAGRYWVTWARKLLARRCWVSLAPPLDRMTLVQVAPEMPHDTGEKPRPVWTPASPLRLCHTGHTLAGLLLPAVLLPALLVLAGPAGALAPRLVPARGIGVEEGGSTRPRPIGRRPLDLRQDWARLMARRGV